MKPVSAQLMYISFNDNVMKKYHELYIKSIQLGKNKYFK